MASTTILRASLSPSLGGAPMRPATAQMVAPATALAVRMMVRGKGASFFTTSHPRLPTTIRLAKSTLSSSVPKSTPTLALAPAPAPATLLKLRPAFRRYYHQDEPPPPPPPPPPPSFPSFVYFTWTTIGVCVIIFTQWFRARAAQLKGDETKMLWMIDNFTLRRKNWEEGRWWTLITSAFSHSNPVHLFFNMFCWRFACQVGMQLLGWRARPMAVLALGSALAGSFGSMYHHATIYPATGGGPNLDPEPFVIGSSGMVQGMLAATALAVPTLKVNLMFIPIPINYWWFVTGVMAFDAYGLLQARRGEVTRNWMGSFTAYATHLGGAAFGIAFYLVRFRLGRGLGPRL